MKLTRRNSLKLSLATAALAVSGAMGITAAQAETSLTAVYYIPPSYPVISYGPQGFVDNVNNSDTGVKIDYYPASQLMKADEQLPGLRSRSIDLMFHTTSYITRSVPILGITGLPGVVGELQRHPERLAKGSPLFNLINEELAKENLIMLSAGGGIFEPEFIWSTEANPIRSLSEVDGKKVRVVSFEATQALEKFGASAVRIPSSETYLALQRGTVDAGVFNISTVIGRSLQEQLKYVYKLPTTAYTVGAFMLLDTYEALDANTKAALDGATDWYDANFTSHGNNDVYPNDFWPRVSAAGIEVLEPSAEDIAKFDEVTQSVWDEWKSQVGDDLANRAIALALGK